MRKEIHFVSAEEAVKEKRERKTKKKKEEEKLKTQPNEGVDMRMPSQEALRGAYALLADLPPEARILYDAVLKNGLVQYDDLEFDGLSSTDCMAVATQMEFLGLVELTQSGLVLRSDAADDT